jgi:hypothetical protein
MYLTGGIRVIEEKEKGHCGLIFKNYGSKYPDHTLIIARPWTIDISLWGGMSRL